jgi:hypothetical protein
MREAAKVNLDTVTATEAEWANRFLYPDGRKPYTLFYNNEGYRHALDLVAKARAASREELTIKQKTSTVRTESYRKTLNGNDIPLTDKDMEETNSFFKSMDDLFKDMDKLFKGFGRKK